MFRKRHPEYYEYNESINNYNTRNKSKSVVPKYFTNNLEKSLRYTTARLFDSLPSCMRALKNEDLFKHLLIKILIHKMYCTVDSYYDVNTKITNVYVFKFKARKDFLKYSTKNSKLYFKMF
jgi:hypothetical protein